MNAIDFRFGQGMGKFSGNNRYFGSLVWTKFISRVAVLGVSNSKRNVMESEGSSDEVGSPDFHLNTLRFGKTRPVRCKECRDKHPFPKVFLNVMGISIKTGHS